MPRQLYGSGLRWEHDVITGIPAVRLDLLTCLIGTA